jgi:hypothetical protein
MMLYCVVLIARERRRRIKRCSSPNVMSQRPPIARVFSTHGASAAADLVANAYSKITCSHRILGRMLAVGFFRFKDK